jgi:hypothetical protein
MSTTWIVSTIGMIHRKPGLRVFTYFPNRNLRARLYSKIIRIPPSRNKKRINKKNIMGFITILFKIKNQFHIYAPNYGVTGPLLKIRKKGKATSSKAHYKLSYPCPWKSNM